MAAGFLSLGLLMPIVPAELMFPTAVAAVFGSLLPDLDSRESELQNFSVGGARVFVPFGIIVRSVSLHRGFMHSVFAWGALSVFASVWLNPYLDPSIIAAFSLGYASHLFLDGCTIIGIPLLWPVKTNFHFLPRWFRITTGSGAEGVVFALLTALCLLLALSMIQAVYA